MIPWTKPALGALIQTLADRPDRPDRLPGRAAHFTAGAEGALVGLEQQPLGHPPSLDVSPWRTEPTSVALTSASQGRTHSRDSIFFEYLSLSSRLEKRGAGQGVNNILVR